MTKVDAHSARPVTGRLLDGKSLAATIRSEVANGVSAFTITTGRIPGLATVLIGDDPASQIYVKNKREACVAAGMSDLHRHLPQSTTQGEAELLIDILADDPAVAGILLQLPLPGHLDAEALINRIPAHKDVDGITTANAGLLAAGRPGLRPCTPSGIERMLDHYGVTLTGATAVVIGRSELVGRPMAAILTSRNATVTLCHSHTRDLFEHCRRADILIVAAGRAGLIGADAIRDGATVIDVGIHRTPNGLVGDVRFDEVEPIAGWITPVPGGVGPMTIAMLLANTLAAAKSQAKHATDE